MFALVIFMGAELDSRGLARDPSHLSFLDAELLSGCYTWLRAA